MQLNDIGRLVERLWARTANRGRRAPPYDLVVMPNHIHGIIWLAGPPVGARRPPVRNDIPTPTECTERNGIPKLLDASPLRRADSARPAGFAAKSLASRVAAFKSQSTFAINRLRKTPGTPVWQRNYYERVIRDEEDLLRIRQYILANPAKWAEDPDNVASGRRPSA